jgi:hypothetical protein
VSVWQSVQWQMVSAVGSTSASKVIRPQWQCPSIFMRLCPGEVMHQNSHTRRVGGTDHNERFVRCQPGPYIKTPRELVEADIGVSVIDRLAAPIRAH